MSSVSSTNSTTKSYSSNGLSGLVSGMDTESMMEKLLSGTQAKIDKQKQQKQLIEWKQTRYQSIITKINTFRSSYFDSAFDSELGGNLQSSAFFNSMVSSVTSGSQVKIVSTDSNASMGDTTVLVTQLAKAAKLTSSVKMSGNQTITGTAMDVDSIKSKLQSDESLSFNLTLDGITKTVSFAKSDFSDIEAINADSIKSVLDDKVEGVFGTYIGVSMTDSKLTFSVNLKDLEGNLEQGHELRITGVEASYFGITPGSTSLLSTSTKLGDISGISGKTYRFSINGVDFDFSASDSVYTMMKKINGSSAGVKISYSSTTDQFQMEASSTGAQYGIDVSQKSGNLLSLMFGSDNISAGTAATGSTLNTSTVTGTALSDAYTTKGAAMSFNVNGAKYTFSLPSRKVAYTKTEIIESLNGWLSDTFGKNTEGTANISYEDGNLKTAAGYYVSFDQTKVDSSNEEAVAAALKTDLAYAMGFSLTGASNGTTGDMAVSDVMGLPGVTLLNSSGEAATTLSDISSVTIDGNTYEMKYSDGKLTIPGSGTIDLSTSTLNSYFGDTLTFGTGETASSAVVAGADLKVKINNVETSRSSNTFSAGGITMTATQTGTEDTVVATNRDADKIVDTVKSFINDYNALVKELYSDLTEEDEYRDYAPLTDAQEDDMSDSQVEKWNKKAQTGLLRNDTYVSTFLQRMRAAFYTKVDSAGIAAYSIGIETSASDYDYSGQLSLNETALRNAIAADPGAVGNLFTDPQSGLSKILADACDATARKSAASPGALVQVAGAENYIANAKNNDMYFELEKINDKLKDLKNKYSDERARYWKKFNAMESVISQFNSQSAMLTSSFSAG